MRLPYSFVFRFLFDGVRVASSNSVVRGFGLRAALRGCRAFRRFRFWFFPLAAHEIIYRGDFGRRAAADDPERVSPGAAPRRSRDGFIHHPKRRRRRQR